MTPPTPTPTPRPGAFKTPQLKTRPLRCRKDNCGAIYVLLFCPTPALGHYALKKCLTRARIDPSDT
eukprot:scaffold18612_cov118-Isochrysis_galbana.AAC.4